MLCEKKKKMNKGTKVGKCIENFARRSALNEKKKLLKTCQQNSTEKLNKSICSRRCLRQIVICQICRETFFANIAFVEEILKTETFCFLLNFVLNL